MTELRNQSKFASLIFLLVSSAAVGCDGGVDAPVIVDAQVTPHPDNSLMATIEVETDVPTSLAIELAAEGLEPLVIPIAETSATTHSVPVLGVRADTEYEVRITAIDESAVEVIDQSLTLTTGSLPDDLPNVDLTVKLPEEMSPGVTIFNVGPFGRPGDPVESNGYFVGLDQEGEVIWYQALAAPANGEARMLANGNFMYGGSGKFFENTMTGETVRTIDLVDAGVEHYHHDFIELPSGNIFAVSAEMRVIDGYVDENGDTVSYNVVGDIIVELTPEGELIKEISLFDLMDPLIIVTEDFHLNFWDRTFEVEGGTKDWTHCNGISYDPRDDSYILSLRHHDAVIKVDRETETLTWTMGEHGDFTMVGDGGFAYHHHAPQIQENGNILLFDNGNTRPLADNEEPYTRAVEFKFNETTMEMEQVWEYRGEEPFFIETGGNADKLPNGNVMMTSGSAMARALVEVTSEATPRVVSEAKLINDGTSTNQMRSAFRIESLYTKVQ